jgi:hypothetical protein
MGGMNLPNSHAKGYDLNVAHWLIERWDGGTVHACAGAGEKEVKW